MDRSLIHRRTTTAASGVLSRIAAVALLGLCAAVCIAQRLPPGAAAQQAAEYRADVPKSIIELQQFRISGSVRIEDASGKPAIATLVNLNPQIGAWYTLTINWSGAHEPTSYHLDAANPRQPVTLAPGDPYALRVRPNPLAEPCTLWSRDARSALDEARATNLPYAPICGQALYVRNPVVGHATSLERITDFLRDHVWGGEHIVTVVKEEFLRDRQLEEIHPHAAQRELERGVSASGPSPIRIDPSSANVTILPEHLGIEIEAAGGELEVGRWYAVTDFPGVWLSALAPGAIERALLARHEASVNALDPVESKALVYLVAFDLRRLDLNFVLGSDHPRLGWSDRPPASVRNPALPGPDGVATSAPLVTNGLVGPWHTASTVAAFTGGFKREHGAFRFGPLAWKNHGSHYGFIEQGVVFSKLQPGLATLAVLNDGSVELKTWTSSDDSILPRVRYARQNGVPLIEYDEARGSGAPGPLVNDWAQGNWSGSSTADLRTLRAGICMQTTEAGRFLIYGYFTDATPSSMARTFEAAQCGYALHLDMNALEHTYLALYLRRGPQLVVEHLSDGMAVVDQHVGTEVVPRFLAAPDNRDFFYLTRRDVPR